MNEFQKDCVEKVVHMNLNAFNSDKALIIEEQINAFIEFIDKICKDPNCIGLTEDNKMQLRKSFHTLINTAQNEIIFNIAKYLKMLNEHKNN